jgi:hypothetical protein
VNALEIPRTVGSRTITAAEVESWFGRSKKLKLRPEKYSEIAAGLTKMRWPSDPPASKGRSNGRSQKSASGFWNFEAATKAAKTLLDDLPAMLLHWKDPEWSADNRAAYAATKSLDEALSTAMPYIEWPLGRYSPQTGRKRPKDWHMHSVLVAKLVMQALVDAGEHKPAFTHNSLVVRIIHKALVRMDFPNSGTLSLDAIGMHLARWDEKYGLLPKDAAAVVTK